MKVAEKISENILDKLSIDFLRNQVLKNAYGNDDTIIAAMDPRMLILWYPVSYTHLTLPTILRV